jgi:hypothetical protein
VGGALRGSASPSPGASPHLAPSTYSPATPPDSSRAAPAWTQPLDPASGEGATAPGGQLLFGLAEPATPRQSKAASAARSTPPGNADASAAGNGGATTAPGMSSPFSTHVSFDLAGTFGPSLTDVFTLPPRGFGGLDAAAGAADAQPLLPFSASPFLPNTGPALARAASVPEAQGEMRHVHLVVLAACGLRSDS